MKAIDYLKQIKRMDAQIDADIEELAQLEALATKTTSVMGGDRVQASSNQQKMESCVVKIVAMKNAITEEIDRYLDFKSEARELLSLCDADCCRLLHSRYFLYKTWEQIAVEMNYTYKWVSGGLHQRALAQLQKILDEVKENHEK